MDGAERELFARTVRGVVESSTASDLDVALRDLGWDEALRDDTRTAVAALFEACGELGGRSPLGAVLGAGLGGGGAADQHTDGVAVLLPALAGADPPGTRTSDRLLVRGLLPSQHADSVLVPARRPGGLELCRVALARLELGPVLPLDPSLGWRHVRGTLAADELEDTQTVTADTWEHAVALGRLALAHELVGAMRRQLELARTHAIDRVQFDRPIAAFQAVRHRLADSLVATEAAADSVEAAWDLGTASAARSAKAVAGSGARRVGRHAQQVLAGMGFTAEHPLPGLVRRTLVLDQALGSAASLGRAIGEEALATRELPSPVRL